MGKLLHGSVTVLYGAGGVVKYYRDRTTMPGI